MIRNIDDLWPEVWYEIGIIKSQFIKRMLNWVAKLSYDVPYAITPISNTYVDVLTQKYGIQGEKIFVIEHGVDITRFHRDTFNDRGGRPASTLIVYSGALSIGYDFEPIVKAAKLLENEPIKFILRGSGTSTNDIENIKSIIRNNKTRNVELRTERLSSKDLVKFLHRADIFVLPMSFAGFDMGLPTKLLEYQALGKPVICISNGEAADYVSSTRSGLVNRTKDPQEIAELIRKLADDKNLAKELGENGYKYVLNNLTIENIGKRFMEIVSARNNSVGIVLDH
jgi:glycosyltransferase involved in cell wall biosynthesis